MKRLGPSELYPACLLKPGETLADHLLPENRDERQRIHRKAAELLRARLKDGDRIYAVRGECGCGYAWYRFSHWSRAWIVTASGIDTIIPASVRMINGEKFRIEDHMEGGDA